MRGTGTGKLVSYIALLTSPNNARCECRAGMPFFWATVYVMVRTAVLSYRSVILFLINIGETTGDSRPHLQ
jgi:hypothetical protein